MPRVLMYCTAACPFCQSAERLLVEKGVKIEKVRVDIEPARRAEMVSRRAGGAPCRRSGSASATSAAATTCTTSTAKAVSSLY